MFFLLDKCSVSSQVGENFLSDPSFPSNPQEFVDNNASLPPQQPANSLISFLKPIKTNVLCNFQKYDI